MTILRNLFLPSLCLAATVLPAQSQFATGSIYVASVQSPSGGSPYNAVTRIDPFSGAQSELLALGGSVYPASMAYDPFRDRLIAYCRLGASANPAVHALDGNGGWSTLSTTYLVRLAPRGDGLIYGYKAGASGNTLQTIYYLDAANQEHALLDVGGASPWLLFGGAPHNGDPIQAMVYEPTENALFLALRGDNLTPTCSGQTLRVSVRKLPLTPNGTALRAPAECSEFDITSLPNAVETPLGFSYGPAGDLVLAVQVSWSGGMPRLLRIDPATNQISAFATTGPYYGDAAIACGVYSPLVGKTLIYDDGNDVLRQFAPGSAGDGEILANFGIPGLGGGICTMCVVGPIGPKATLQADVPAISATSGGVQQLTFSPGAAHVGDAYLILGSMSGWAPGFPLGGLQVPLNPDPYSTLTIELANSPFLVGTLGVIGPSGSVTSYLVAPPALLSPYVGTVLHHAAITASAPNVFTHASNPVPLTVVP